ncbi:hypothetical protein Aspvir_001438 [Aspergillus viridinutans]|uniref:DNA2/NAM7 helicase-like C-terminal domain-containing protein n=1 Tax=Aspergillus viridinutans TaxID=75553 RepID=A0A9P3EZI4_ASPVI|nr:uncharacterized protein Aspvir_001438 [Aspergillus viridinutans]GIJ99308.1 hypothetical protein Aspvir_001438 [Aspergillus viridinutans]
MTKPSEDVLSVGFVGNRNRLNVALSRAQKGLIIIGNLRTWNSEAIKEIVKSSGKRNKFLLDLLRDVTQKGHTLTWHGAPTSTFRMIERSGVRTREQRIRLLQPRQGYNRKRPPFRSPEHGSRFQGASYRQALQQAPPKRPLPWLSAAPQQDEGVAADEDVEMVDFQDQGTPYPGSKSREMSSSPSNHIGTK